MFFEKLKRQYLAWCIFTSGIGVSHIIESVRAFDPLALIVNAFMVLALAFLCYCIAYCVCAVLSLLGINLPKFLSLLLITLVLFSVMAVPNTEANMKEGAKNVARGVFIFVAGVIIDDAADEVWDAGSEWMQEQVDTYVYEPIGDAVSHVWDEFTHANCQVCNPPPPDNTPNCSYCTDGCSSCQSSSSSSSDYTYTCSDCEETVPYYMSESHSCN